MTQRAVYDAMVFLQWAATPPESGRQHATVSAITSGRVRLCLSPELFEEVRDVLTPPELRERLPALTPDHVGKILAKTLEYADWFTEVPKRFSLPNHPKDDHVFNLGIAAKAAYLVTWEERLLHLHQYDPNAAGELRKLAPDLRVLSPKQFSNVFHPGRIT